MMPAFIISVEQFCILPEQIFTTSNTLYMLTYSYIIYLRVCTLVTTSDFVLHKLQKAKNGLLTFLNKTFSILY